MGDDRLSSLALMHVHRSFDIGMEVVIGAYRNCYKFRQKRSIKILKSQTPVRITLSMRPIMHSYATVLLWLNLIFKLFL